MGSRTVVPCSCNSLQIVSLLQGTITKPKEKVGVVRRAKDKLEEVSGSDRSFAKANASSRKLLQLLLGFSHSRFGCSAVFHGIREYAAYAEQTEPELRQKRLQRLRWPQRSCRQRTSTRAKDRVTGG